MIHAAPAAIAATPIATQPAGNDPTVHSTVVPEFVAQAAEQVGIQVASINIEQVHDIITP